MDVSNNIGMHSIRTLLRIHSVKYILFIVAIAWAIGLMGAKPVKAASFDLIKTPSNPDIYIRVPWGRYRVYDQDTWNRWGLNWGMMHVISDAEMAAIPRGPDITKALRPFGDPTVYVIEAGQIRAVTSADAFLLAGYKWSDVRDVEPSIIFQLPRAVNLDIPQTVRSPRDGRIFYIYNGQRRHITNPNVWHHWGFTTYSESSYVDTLPEGPALTNLVRPYGDPTVWVMDNGYRRALPSPDALLLNDLSWSDVVDADAGLIMSRPAADIFWAPSTVQYPGSSSIYYVANSVRYLVPDEDTRLNWGLQNQGFRVTANTLKLPEAAHLSRLVRTEDGTVWRVKDGQRRSVPSAGAFDGYGFKWSDVSNMPASALALLGNAGTLPVTSDVLNNVSIPSTSGKVGLEQHLYTTGGDADAASHYSLQGVADWGSSINIRNGVAGTGAFGKLAPEIEKYYITMRWNYVDWFEDPNPSVCGTSSAYAGRLATCTRNLNSSLMKWHSGKKVIVTNTRTGKKIVAGVGESGPAIWVTRERGVVAGLSPEATDYIVGSQYGANGDVLQYAWSLDQTLPYGPLTW